ncbi:glycoside hydrolase N-terminal domain-containing protein [Arcanobacterium hippocoleae]
MDERKNRVKADKPYLGALKPLNQGDFGEKFVSTDTNDGTDAKMGLVEFNLSSLTEAPQSAKFQLTYLGHRGNPTATDTATISVTPVDTAQCTDNAQTCGANTATWAKRPNFTVSSENTATSAAFQYGSVTYGADVITVNPDNAVTVEIDVTALVEQQFAQDKKVITFAVQENKGKELRFASTEGAGGLLPGSAQEMAPRMVITEAVPETSLAITTLPAKVTYNKGEAFDPAGLAVTKNHVSGTSEQLAADQYTLDSSEFHADHVGAYPIKVALKSDPKITATFNVYVVSSTADEGDGDTTHDELLWYTAPSSQTPNGSVSAGSIGSGNDNDKWQRTTLPVGNGKVGGTIWGEVSRERITFNEETLWTGGPGTTSTYNGGNNESKGRNGATLRELNKQLENGSQTVNPNNLTGGENPAEQGAYQNWGNIYINYGFDNASVTNYKRSLNISKALANVAFTKDGVDYQRQFFVSNPDNVMVARLTAKQAGAMNLGITFPTNPGALKNGETSVIAGDTLTVRGALANNGLLYNAKIKAVLDNGEGTVSAGENGELKISNAAGVTLYIAAATEYKNEWPKYRSGENEQTLDTRVAGYVQNAADKGFDAVKAAHIEDHAQYYDRVSIDLGQSGHADAGAIATDKLIDKYKTGQATEEQKRELEMLIYQYGRYLTIASSRENSQLPSNLQGIWSSTADSNGHGATPWGSDFHMNVNLQMNYWPTYSGNMAELAEPLIAYAESLVEPGRITAKIYAGASTEPGTKIGQGNGYMVHTENTAYGWTTPGYAFAWGWSPAAMPWLLQNVYEAWEYTGIKIC